jgi:hypothetical protein
MLAISRPTLLASFPSLPALLRSAPSLLSIESSPPPPLCSIQASVPTLSVDILRPTPHSSPSHDDVNSAPPSTSPLSPRPPPLPPSAQDELRRPDLVHSLRPLVLPGRLNLPHSLRPFRIDDAIRRARGTERVPARAAAAGVRTAGRTVECDYQESAEFRSSRSFFFFFGLRLLCAGDASLSHVADLPRRSLHGRPAIRAISVPSTANSLSSQEGRLRLFQVDVDAADFRSPSHLCLCAGDRPYPRVRCSAHELLVHHSLLLQAVSATDS